MNPFAQFSIDLGDGKPPKTFFVRTSDIISIGPLLPQNPPTLNRTVLKNAKQEEYWAMESAEDCCRRIRIAEAT
jgi:hypothetical protein